uniref:Variant surface glycoprotein 643 n=1 Tax=Trypanosoma brucei TaxID=5691 RepID=M4SYL2_9TRYP|nr:variant surface glycoprotein 643 [Trypanosoma brucei]
MLKVLALTLLLQSRADGTAVTAGSNADAYSALCSAIRVARGQVKTEEQVLRTESYKKTAAAVAVAAAGVSSIEAAAKATDKPEPKLPANSAGNETCEAISWEMCLLGLRELKEKKGTTEAQMWIKARHNEVTMQQLQHALRRFRQVSARLDQLNTEETAKLANKHLKKALIGADDNEQGLTIVTGTMTRDQACGARPATPGKLAGTSLQADMLCLCANPGGGSAQPNICGGRTATTGQTAEQDTKLKSDWEKLAASCGDPLSSDELQRGAIDNAIATVWSSITTGKGQENKYHFALGNIPTGGDGKCDATSDSNGAACVIYEHETATGLPKEIKWMQEMKAAAAAVRTLAKERQERSTLVAELQTLNLTLSNIGLGANTEVKNHPLSEKKADNQLDDTENQCEQAGTDESKCKSLKDQGCVFNSKARKCELKKELKEKLEKENQEDKDGKTNTTGSNSFVINKTPLLLAFLLF